MWTPNSVQNQNQLFCTTATKVILPSTTYEESAVDTFALYVLLIITNFCSRKNCIKKPDRMKMPAQKKPPHVLYHVNFVANYSVCANQPIP